MSAATDWLTSIGTTAAVIAAVGIATWPSIRERRLRPVLRPVVGEREPLERPVWNGAQIERFLLRVQVHNAGRSTAKAVSVTTTEWLHRPDGKGVWERLDIDPTTARPSAVHSAFHLDIVAGGNTLFDLLQWVSTPATLSLLGPEGVSLPFVPVRNPWGAHVVDVTIAAENAPAVRRYIGFRVGPGEPEETGIRHPPLYAVKFLTGTPADETVMDVGFIQLLSQPPPPLPGVEEI